MKSFNPTDIEDKECVPSYLILQSRENSIQRSEIAQVLRCKMATQAQNGSGEQELIPLVSSCKFSCYFFSPEAKQHNIRVQRFATQVFRYSITDSVHFGKVEYLSQWPAASMKNISLMSDEPTAFTLRPISGSQVLCDDLRGMATSESNYIEPDQETVPLVLLPRKCELTPPKERNLVHVHCPGHMLRDSRDPCDSEQGNWNKCVSDSEFLGVFLVVIASCSPWRQVSPRVRCQCFY